MGNEPRRARPGAAASVYRQESTQTWGVIGLSHRLARFPMWATAVGRPRGTNGNSMSLSRAEQAFTALAIETRDREPGTQSWSRDVSWL